MGALLIGAVGVPSIATAQAGTVSGSISVVLDFSAGTDRGVATFTTQNLSSTTAWGRAEVTFPDGSTAELGPTRYAAGERRVDRVALVGCSCDNVDEASLIAWGFTSRSDTSPDWSSGVMTTSDPRVTVIGCTTPTPPPTPTPTPTTTPTPTPTASASPTVSPTSTPTTTPSPVAAGTTSGGQLSATGLRGDVVAIVLLIGLGGLAVGAALVFLARRRRV